jgi:hypothetical protein
MTTTMQTNVWDGDENLTKMLGLAAKMLREMSEPRPSGEYKKSTIERVAKMAGLGYWRAFDLWYAKARRVEPFEIEQIAAAMQAKNERDAANELRELKSRLLRLESRLASGDANFHSPTIDFAREHLRQLGSGDRALAGK